jgi:hypothetical protein
MTITSTDVSAPALASITFDCANAAVLAGFWAAALDRPLVTPMDGYAQLPGSPTWSFFSVPEPKTVKNRVHVDLEVADLAAAADRLVALGAARLGDFDEAGYRWVTLTDPEGNEFDIVASE